MPQHEQGTQASDEAQTEVFHTQGADDNDDNAPMVYEIPIDYRTWALQEKPGLEAEGHQVVLQSELPKHILKRGPEESAEDYTKRYVDAMNDMIGRGVQILNDQCVADVMPGGFSTGKRTFDLGPGSEATRKEYREFSEWFGSEEAQASGREPVPERFLRFEVKDGE